MGARRAPSGKAIVIGVVLHHLRLNLRRVAQIDGGVEHLQDRAAAAFDARAARLHNHSRLHLRDARRLEQPLPFNLDHAQPTDRVGRTRVVIADGGDVAPQPARRLQDRCAFGNGDLLPVNGQRNFAHSVFPFSNSSGQRLIALKTAAAAVCPSPHSEASVIVQPTSCKRRTSPDSSSPSANRSRISN
jgi:hypothetical protein